MSVKLAIIADDFTGSNDTGVQFSKKGLETRVIFNKSEIKKISNETEVIVIDTESRADKKNVARKKVLESAEELISQGVNYVYKKLDSTLRGNIGSEIEGAIDGGNFDFAIVAPAMPSNNRKTIGGNQIVHDVPLEKTEIAQDPVTPVKETYIPDIISKQTNKKVSLINLKDVIKGKDNVINKINKILEENVEIIVIDALNKEDLDTIAKAIKEIDKKCLLVGSAGFAESLPDNLDLNKNKKKKKVDKTIAGIVGSVSDITRRQVDYAKDNLNNLDIIDIKIENVLGERFQQEIERIIKFHKQNKMKDIIIRSAPKREMVKKAYKIGEKNNLSENEVSKRIAKFMGKLSKKLFLEDNVKGLFLTGGDIAIESASIIGANSNIIKDEVLPGVPLSFLSGKGLPQKPVVTKAGAFGGKKSIVEIFKFLRKW